jgi:GH15 family glucan-1,4-alpha-glucosidase
MGESGYAPIEAYGIVGNLETCALVAPDGSIDWFPFPHVESPSILAAILDDEDGGRFRIEPAEQYETGQQYVETTNVLETTFRTANGRATVTDFLPPAGEVDQPKKVIYRKVTCSDGSVTLDIEFDPQFDYGRAETTITATDEGILAEGDEEQALLENPVDLEISDGRVTSEVTLEAGDAEWFLLRCTGAEDAAAEPEVALEQTVEFWTDWAHTCDAEGECAFGGPWHDVVVRSSLLLKLLTHVETGSVFAAPTTSLPEEIGGVRNWDYRYNWVRDAGFTVQALMNLTHVEEAVDYFEWFMDICQTDDPEKIQPLYGLHGETDLEERELDHLDGYRNSRPVRVGNGAVDQTQLDIYGELLLAVDEMLGHGHRIDDDEWTTVRNIVEYVREIWDGRDAGIWEIRGGERHFVYSKVMCWVALDRGIEIADEYGHDAPLDEWRNERATIKADVLENGYDEDVGAFVQAYDADALDATGLLLPIVGFLPFDDERIQGTIDAIEDTLAEGDVLVDRYNGEDGLSGDEGAFVLCSCWLIDALALSGRVDEARERFEALLEYVSPLDLVAEELDTDSGAHLGNFPQGFSHIGIINSALYVGYAQGENSPGPPPMGVRLGDPMLPDRE